MRHIFQAFGDDFQPLVAVVAGRNSSILVTYFSAYQTSFCMHGKYLPPQIYLNKDIFIPKEYNPHFKCVLDFFRSL